MEILNENGRLTANRDNRTLKETVIGQVKATGILPAMKLKKKTDFMAWAQALCEGGARVIEITMTTPGVLEAIEAISSEFKGRLWVVSGTTLDATSAREVILHGGAGIVNPCLIPEVIDLARRYGVPIFSGAFTATEVFTAWRAGADMIKIFPAQLGGPKYMTNLKMVFPEVDLCPSGGLSLETAGEFIRCGACAVSGARNFVDAEQIERHGTGWISEQCRKYLQIVREARASAPELP